MLAPRWLTLVAALLVGCAGKSGDPTTGEASGGAGSGSSSLHACDPLASVTSAVQLEAAQVVAAGSAADGTFYVVYGDERLFVGDPDGLVERVVIGLGQTGSQTDLDYTDDDGTAVKVEVTEDGGTTQMRVARGEQSSKGVDPGSGEVLTPADAEMIASIPASTTASFVIDFAASLVDGRELVVVAPEHDVEYEQFRVFLGPTTDLAQRAVSNFGSSRSGQRFATLTIDGAAAELTYLAGGSTVLNPNGGPTTLTVSGTVLELTENAAPDDGIYRCLQK